MKAKLTASLLAIFIFAAGFAAGTLFDHLCHEKGRKAFYKKFRGPERFDRVKDRLQEKFTRELKLTGQQQTELKGILLHWMTAMKEKVKVRDQELEGIKEEHRQKIREILTPDQKIRFNEMVEEYKARLAKWKK